MSGSIKEEFTVSAVEVSKHSSQISNNQSPNGIMTIIAESRPENGFKFKEMKLDDSIVDELEQAAKNLKANLGKLNQEKLDE